MEESAVIERARDLLGVELDPSLYTAQVLGGERQTCVRFFLPVQYVPLDSAAYYEVTIDTTDGTTYYSALYNPPEQSGETDALCFYEPTERDLGALDFVADALSREMGFDFRTEDPDGTMIIYEKETHFDITVVSPFQESWYKIDRRTGRMYDEGHAHLVPPPEF